MKTAELFFPDQQRCIFCGKPFVPRSFGACAACLAQLEEGRDIRPVALAPRVEGMAAFAYRGKPRDCLLGFKFKGETWRCADMTRWMAWALEKSDGQMVVAVPIHPLRRMGRGYGQCVLLGRMLARELGLPYENWALVRRRHTKPMYMISIGEHDRAVAGRFGPGPGITRVVGRRVVLVDDVCTTGSTLRECVRLLTEAGAACVEAVCFAAVEGESAPRGLY